MPQSTGPSARPVPSHVAIIMDGNGRWAKANGKSRIAGHRAGAEGVRDIVRAASGLGVKVLSLYAFSAENFTRPRTEVAALFKLLKRFIASEVPELIENNVRLKALGRLTDLPEDVQQVLSKGESDTSQCDGMTLGLAVSYGSQDELVDAARALALDVRNGMIQPDAIGREDVERRLYTAGLGPVDLLIRTGGDCRLSNFMLWQASYAELYFTPVFWPDFGREELEEALEEFARRDRRFGGI